MLTVAHRAGNDLPLLRRCESHGVTWVEADVRLFRGRLEVRHLKSVGPLPVFWDTWAFAAPWRRQLRLDELLEAAAPDTHLLLDLKGKDGRLPALVRSALARRPRPVTMCGRFWPLLEAVRDAPDVGFAPSAGTRKELALLLDRYRDGGLRGACIRASLLDERTVARLHAIAGLVLAWPVAGPEQVARLAAWGVDGAITASDALLAPASRPRLVPAQP